MFFFTSLTFTFKSYSLLPWTVCHRLCQHFSKCQPATVSLHVLYLRLVTEHRATQLIDYVYRTCIYVLCMFLFTLLTSRLSLKKENTFLFITEHRFYTTQTVRLLLEGSFPTVKGFQLVVFDVSMHGVIATTPVCCSVPPPPPAHLLSGAQCGSQTCNKQEGPQLDLGKMGTFRGITKRLE